MQSHYRSYKANPLQIFQGCSHYRSYKAKQAAVITDLPRLQSLQIFQGQAGCSHYRSYKAAVITDLPRPSRLQSLQIFQGCSHYRSYKAKQAAVITDLTRPSRLQSLQILQGQAQPNSSWSDENWLWIKQKSIVGPLKNRNEPWNPVLVYEPDSLKESCKTWSLRNIMSLNELHEPEHLRKIMSLTPELILWAWAFNESYESDPELILWAWVFNESYESDLELMLWVWAFK